MGNISQSGSQKVLIGPSTSQFSCPALSPEALDNGCVPACGCSYCCQAEPPWVLWRPQSCVFRQCFCLTVLSIERLFELCRWDVSGETMEAILVVPVDAAEGC